MSGDPHWDTGIGRCRLGAQELLRAGDRDRRTGTIRCRLHVNIQKVATMSPTNSCAICADNAEADSGLEPWSVARLETGYVRLNPNQFFPGATLFLAKRCVAELHELDQPFRQLHLAEMAEVAAAVFEAFRPRKLKYEALGNGVPHLHWWLTPRYPTDSRPFTPIWEDLEFLRAQWTDGARPSDDQREELRSDLLEALKKRHVMVEQEFA